MKIDLGINGWNRTKPPHKLSEGQASKLQNYIIQDGCIRKVGGTQAYNSTALSALGIPFALRSYHIRADGEIAKRLHIYNDGALYYGNDLTGSFTIAPGTETLSKGTIPTSFIMQVAGNSIAYLLTGKDIVRKYDGNGSYKWEQCGSSLKTITNYESGIIHLDKAWYIVRQSSEIDYSESLDPETIADTVTIGKDKDSYCVRFVEGAGETLYVFKNNSIYQLYGRTPSQFQFRKVTDKYGLASKRGISPVGSGFIFLNTFDKELYFFGGTESSIRPMTEDDIRLREIMDWTEDSVNNVDMTVHNGFFRFAFQSLDSTIDTNNCELVYNINDPSASGLPKWSLIKGSNVLSYSVWDNYGDRQELVTGRSDTGKIMYHNRTHNFDGVAVETIVRTAEIVASDEYVVRFNGFYVKGKPGSTDKDVTFKYFLNGRYSDRGEDSLIVAGETRTVGVMKISTQSLFNDCITPLTEYSRGNSVSFELTQNELNTTSELYSIAFKASKRYKIRNQLL